MPGQARTKWGVFSHNQSSDLRILNSLLLGSRAIFFILLSSASSGGKCFEFSLSVTHCRLILKAEVELLACAKIWRAHKKTSYITCWCLLNRVPDLPTWGQSTDSSKNIVVCFTNTHFHFRVAKQKKIKNRSQRTSFGRVKYSLNIRIQLA